MANPNPPRQLILTVFETRRRLFRPGLWSRWELRQQQNCGGVIIRWAIATGDVKRHRKERMVEFNLGEETPLSLSVGELDQELRRSGRLGG